MAKMNLKFARQKANASEEEALKAVVEATGVQQCNLVPAHTEKMWYWEHDEKKFVFKNEDENSLEKAVIAAADYFATVIPNIKHEETETHYILSKYRG